MFTNFDFLNASQRLRRGFLLTARLIFGKTLTCNSTTGYDGVYLLAQQLAPHASFTLTWPCGVLADEPAKVYRQQGGKWPQRYLADALLCLACGGELVANME